MSCCHKILYFYRFFNNVWGFFSFCNNFFLSNLQKFGFILRYNHKVFVFFFFIKMAKSPCQLVIFTFLFVFCANNIFYLCIIIFKVSKYHYETFIYKTFSKVLLCFHIQQKLFIVFFQFCVFILDFLSLDLFLNGVCIFMCFLQHC